MTRTCALLVAIAALLVACGKYGPPRRVERKPAVPATAELEVAPEPHEADQADQADQADENQEKNP